MSDLIDRLRALLPNVTPGEWRNEGGENYTVVDESGMPIAYYVSARHRPLIALAPQTAEAYLAAQDQIDALTAERDQLRNALHLISLWSVGSGMSMEALGRTARAALAEPEPKG